MVVHSWLEPRRRAQLLADVQQKLDKSTTTLSVLSNRAVSSQDTVSQVQLSSNGLVNNNFDTEGLRDIIRTELVQAWQKRETEAATLRREIDLLRRDAELRAQSIVISIAPETTTQERSGESTLRSIESSISEPPASIVSAGTSSAVRMDRRELASEALVVSTVGSALGALFAALVMK